MNHPAVGYIVNGTIAIVLSFLAWRITDNYWAWLALFAPGAALMFYGWVVALRR